MALSEERSAATPMLHASRLSVGYARGRRLRRRVLNDLDLELEAGELVCLLGPNGVGKTTLLRTLAGIQPPLSGEVRLDGVDLFTLDSRQRARRVAVVLTDPVRVALLQVEALVGLGRFPYTDWTGRLKASDRTRVAEALELVGAAELAHREVGELSDGERQKVMIARAVVQEGDVMILDEPTAFLDVARRAEVMAILRRLSREAGKAILVATHDLDLALQGSDRLWLLGEEGRLVSGGPEDLVLSGALRRLFEGSEVRFDEMEGRLRLPVKGWTTARLEGEGEPAVWTRRALQREGIEVVERDEVAAVVRLEMGDPLRWSSVAGGGEELHGSIYELVRSLRRRLPSGGDR